MRRTSLFFICLLTGIILLLPSTPISAQNAVDPLRFEKEIAAFEQEDRENPPPANPILFIGSSSIRMWKTLAEDMAPLPVINRGFGGSHASDAIYYFDRIVLPYRPKAIVFYEGDNDIASGKPPQMVFDDFKTFVDLVRTNLPGTPVFYLPIKPSVSRWGVWNEMSEANQLIKEYTDKQKDLHYLDTASVMLDKNGVVRRDIFLDDNLHMNALGYDLWTGVVKPALVKFAETHRPVTFDQAHRMLLAKANVSVSGAAPRAQADPLIPVYHLRTAANWINDPNGPVYFNGEYHMFFQHNPYGPNWGNMSWGHAVSTDLAHWKHLPIALTPNPMSYDRGGVFSGCCVIADGVPTIFYTGVLEPDETGFRKQVQCIATSGDNLRTWTKYPGNPVIAERPRPDLEGFRDPFTWQEDDGYWYCVIGSGIKGEGGAALLYRSRDLINWDYLHPLCTGFGQNWECPNFFPLGGKHVLVVSPHGECKYTVGDYDTSSHTFSPGLWQRMDFGGRPGFYAPNCMEAPDGRRIMWGWINSGGTEGYPWKGSLTLPRVVTLRDDGTLGFAPADELKALRGQHYQFQGLRITPGSPHDLGGLKTDCCEIIAVFEPGNAAAFGIELRRSPDGAETTPITYDAQNLRLHSGAASGQFQLLPGEDTLTLHIFLDKSVVEVYANGRACLTRSTLPKRPDSLGIRIFSEGRPVTVRTVDVWEMGNMWE